MASSQAFAATHIRNVKITEAALKCAGRFIFSVESLSRSLGAEWEIVYASRTAVVEFLRQNIRNKLEILVETQRKVSTRKRPPSHWSDLAPHSLVSVVAAQLTHLTQVIGLLNALLEALDASGVGSAEQGQSTTRAVLGAAFSNPAMLDLLRACVATEEDLRRREEFAQLSRFEQMEDDDQRRGPPGANLTQSHSLRSFSPQRKPSHADTLAAIVAQLGDATSPLGRRIRRLCGTVEEWIWEGYSGSAVGERLAEFVDEMVGDIRQEDAGGKAGGFRRSLASIRTREWALVPEDLVAAAVEDELYSDQAMHHGLLGALRAHDDDKVIQEVMLRFAGASQASLHVPELFVAKGDSVPYAHSIATLKTIALYRTPTRKLLAIKQAARVLVREMKRVGLENGAAKEKLVIGGDDFIPMFVFVALNCGVETLGSEVNLVRHCLPRILRHGELGYFATTLEFATEFIKNMAGAVPPLSEGSGALLGLVDHGFARRWAASGEVRLRSGETTLSGLRTVVRFGDASPRAPLVVAFEAPRKKEDDESNSSASVGFEERSVVVSVVDLSGLNDVQRTAVEELMETFGLSLVEWATTEGERVLVATVPAQAPSSTDCDSNTWKHISLDNLCALDAHKKVLVTRSEQVSPGTMHEIDQAVLCWLSGLQQDIPWKSQTTTGIPRVDAVLALQEVLFFTAQLPYALITGSFCAQTWQALEFLSRRCQRDTWESVKAAAHKCRGAAAALQNELVAVPTPSVSPQLDEFVELVRRYQSKHGLAPSGVLDDPTSVRMAI